MLNAKAELLNQLKAITLNRGWSHSEMARQLGMQQEAWAECRVGKRAIPLATATHAGDIFPELRWVANSYVIEQVRTQKERRKKRMAVS